jgi:transcriptional regulator GlxA family with amidase domain
MSIWMGRCGAILVAEMDRRAGPIESRRVLVLLLPQVHLLDLAGPVQTFWEANGFGAAYRISYVAALPRVTTAQGLVLADLEPLADPQPGDLVLVPGMDSTTVAGLGAHVPAEWLRTADARGARIASICSGAFALGRAGLLDGRTCTTHWKMAARLQREHPRARVVQNRLFVKDGGLVTSAGVASGIDMALSMVEDDHGPLLTARVAREMVVYLRRHGDREQQSVFLEYRTHLHPGVHRVQDWLVARPDERPSLDALAERAGMSVRNLTRVFRRETGISLKEFAHRVKLQVARDLLGSPELKVEAVASRCGFEDARQLRRLWREAYGTSVSEWRRDAVGQ